MLNKDSFLLKKRRQKRRFEEGGRKGEGEVEGHNNKEDKQKQLEMGDSCVLLMLIMMEVIGSKKNL